MTLKAWHIPNENGDYELLERDGGTWLIVENPTPDERAKLNRFLEGARSKGWVSESDAYNLTGRTELPIKATVVEAGLLLAPTVRGDLTAVRSINGQVTAVLRVTDGAAGDAGPAEVAAVTAPTAEVATTVRRPTLCCPQPVLGPMVRAEGVLDKFLSARQRRTWRDHGYVECLGGLSKHVYRIHHREHPRAVELGYITFDCDDGRVLHGHDWTVPPAEEVLSFVLWLSSRHEWYVRCDASGFGQWRRAMGLPEPPYGLDYGTGDARVVSMFGSLGGGRG